MVKKKNIKKTYKIKNVNGRCINVNTVSLTKKTVPLMNGQEFDFVVYDEVDYIELNSLERLKLIKIMGEKK